MRKYARLLLSASLLTFTSCNMILGLEGMKETYLENQSSYIVSIKYNNGGYHETDELSPGESLTLSGSWTGRDIRWSSESFVILEETDDGYFFKDE